MEEFPRGRIVIATDDRLQKEFQRYASLPGVQVMGFWERGSGTLWVSPDEVTRFDVNRTVLPNMETLGHELMHHTRGLWHGPLNSVKP